MSEQWTYKVDKINTVVPDATEKLLAERGKDGYELVSAYREGPFLHAIFKKQVPNG
jgi:sortase (surface protein transpeptidase)